MINLPATHTRRFRGALLCLALPAVIGIGCLHALADVHPEQNDMAAAQTGVEFQPRLGDYHYEITWGQSLLATASISVDREDDHYVLKADQGTSSRSKPNRASELSNFAWSSTGKSNPIRIMRAPFTPNEASS